MAARSVILIAAACVLMAFGAARAGDAPRPRDDLKRLRGLATFQVSVPVYVSGSGMPADWDRSSGCRVERQALERRGAETLRNAALDAIPAFEGLAMMAAAVAGMKQDRQSYQGVPPQDVVVSSQRRREEMTKLSARATLYVRIAIEPVEGGLCAAGIVADLRASPRERTTVRDSGEQVLAPLRLWEGPPLALAAPAPVLQQAVEQRLDRIVAALITAWRTANGVQ